MANDQGAERTCVSRARMPAHRDSVAGIDLIGDGEVDIGEAARKARTASFQASMPEIGSGTPCSGVTHTVFADLTTAYSSGTWRVIRCYRVVI